MVLTKEIENKIVDFVRAQPRTIQEIAHALSKNWRTADAYVERIARESGIIATRTFRGGTRGALKIVYLNAINVKGSAYQERLLQSILTAKHKEDFSPLDIYQFVPENKRNAYLQEKEFSEHSELKFNKLVLNAKKQILFYSGNLSWIELGPKMMKVLDELVKNKVDIKILTRVDITSKDTIKKIMAINQRAGRDAITIRHCEQPLRAVIIDDELASIKETLTPQIREVKKKKFLFYKIIDYEWINFLQKTFWHLWEQSVDATARIEALNEIKE